MGKFIMARSFLKTETTFLERLVVLEKWVSTRKCGEALKKELAEFCECETDQKFENFVNRQLLRLVKAVGHGHIAYGFFMELDIMRFQNRVLNDERFHEGLRRVLGKIVRTPKLFAKADDSFSKLDIVKFLNRVLDDEHFDEALKSEIRELILPPELFAEVN
jgi:hypothetical protein